MDPTNIIKGALGLVSILYPPAAPVIGILEAASPYLVAAIPLVKAAIEEGPGAFKAAEEASPQLSAAIKSIADHALTLGKSFGSTPEAHTENIARAIFGFPQMTFEEEMKWMNDTTPHNDPSQENSNVGSG